MSLRKHILNLSLRLIEKPHLARTKNPQKLRKVFELKASFWFRTPKGSTFREEVLRAGDQSIPVLWAQGPGATKNGVILYFHGGGYVFGSPRTHSAMLARLSLLTGMMACLPEYRLAPEHPFPAVIDDCIASYQALLNCGFASKDIVIGGDSAGGGLALAVLGQICATGLPQPAGVLGLSPLLDMSYSSGSFVSNAKSEVVLPVSRAAEMRGMYLADADPTDPRASPLFADLSGAPPIYLTVSDTEILLDDTTRMEARWKAQGVEIETHVSKNLPHVWQIFQNLMPEADASLCDIAGWIRRLAPRNIAEN